MEEERRRGAGGHVGSSSTQHHHVLFLGTWMQHGSGFPNTRLVTAQMLCTVQSQPDMRMPKKRSFARKSSRSRWQMVRYLHRYPCSCSRDDILCFLRSPSFLIIAARNVWNGSGFFTTSRAHQHRYHTAPAIDIAKLLYRYVAPQSCRVECFG